MPKHLVLTALVVAFLLIQATKVSGCSCVKHEVPRAFAEARAVFLGEVIDIDEPRTDSPTAPLAERLFQIHFKVERSWKGAATRETVILSDQGRAGCFSWGPFVKGQKYLVYAESRTPSGKSIKPLAVLFSCNRTELLANATDDLRELDAMRKALNQPKRAGRSGERLRSSVIAACRES